MIDGSEADLDKIGEISFTLWVPCASSGVCPETLHQLQNMRGPPVPIFALQAKNTTDGYKVSARDDEVFWLAASGSKAEIL